MGVTEISEEGLRFIADFEGFRATPYNDPAGHCTVGYGFLLHYGNCTAAELATAPLDEEEGLRLLHEKVKPYVAEVVGDCRPLRQNELDAMASFCYNIGRGGFARSNVRVAVNAGGDVCAELRRIVRGTDGVVYPGLVRRREAECALFTREEEYMDSETRAAIGQILEQLGALGKKTDDLQRLMAISLPLLADGKAAELKALLEALGR